MAATTGYAPVNGLQMYYEIHGQGEPLVLLHGGFGVVAMFRAIIPGLAQARQVIGVELQGHGHTADIERPIEPEQMADDVAALLAHLGIPGADLLGYSMGGKVAIQVALRHPELVRKLVVVSAPFSYDGWDPIAVSGSSAMDEQWAEAMHDTPMYEAYVNSAPRVEDWPRLVRKVGQSVGRDFDWKAQAAALQAPTLIVVGDNDFVRLEHALEMFKLLGGGAPYVQGPMPAAQLAVLPGVSHFDSFMRADLLLPVVLPFLQAEAAAGDPQVGHKVSVQGE